MPDDETHNRPDILGGIILAVIVLLIFLGARSATSSSARTCPDGSSPVYYGPEAGEGFQC